MEELSLEVKIIGLAICLGAIVLLAATQDRLIKLLRRSPKSIKTYKSERKFFLRG